MDDVSVVSISALSDADMIGSISRHAAIDEPTLWVGVSKVAAGTATGWHHHGTNTTVFYMLSGSLIVEHGDDRVESAIATAGDLAVVPAGVVHREIVEADDAVEAVVVRFGDGTGPLVVEVDRGTDT
jgi:uncharacterized RmlC-like cupin family protein